MAEPIQRTRQLPPQEQPPADPLTEIVRHGIQVALHEIQTTCEADPNSDHRLWYHDSVHTGHVVRRTKRLAEAIHQYEPSAFSQRDMQLSSLIAAWHDVVQEWEFYQETRPTGFPKEGRRAKIGRNERSTAKRLIDYMVEQNAAAPTPVFTDQDMQLVREALDATIPSFTAKGEVWQAHLTPDSSIVARVIALADLDTVGIDGPDNYKYDGNMYFWELNPDIARAVREKTSLGSDLKADYRARMVSWLHTQVAFAQHRFSRLDEELTGLEPALAAHLKNTIIRPATFQASIQMAEQRVSRAQTQSYEELVEELGIVTPPQIE